MSIFEKKKKADGEPFDSKTPVPVRPAEPAPAPAAPARYGIDDAIALLRKLPQDNVELVVRVVRATLESVNIRVYEIVRAAGERLQSVDAKITSEKTRIIELQNEIVTRQAEIDRLQKQFDETEMVKQKLILAEELEDDGAVQVHPDNVIIELKKK